MGKKQVGLGDPVGNQNLAEVPNAGTAIENHHMGPAANFDTRRIPAVANGIFPGTGYRAAHTPEADEKIGVSGHDLVLFRSEMEGALPANGSVAIGLNGSPPTDAHRGLRLF